VDETKLQTFLKTDDVLSADRVRAPERFVEVFAIPAAEFSGTVVDEVEWATAFEDALELAKLADVAACVKREFDVSAEAETDLVGLVLYVAGDDVMATLA
jgi:hypothetical protein